MKIVQSLFGRSGSLPVLKFSNSILMLSTERTPIYIRAEIYKWLITWNFYEYVLGFENCVWMNGVWFFTGTAVSILRGLKRSAFAILQDTKKQPFGPGANFGLSGVIVISFKPIQELASKNIGACHSMMTVLALWSNVKVKFWKSPDKCIYLILLWKSNSIQLYKMASLVLHLVLASLK